MGSSSSLNKDKKRNANKIINNQVNEEAKEEKYDSPKTNLNKVNKNLIKNDNHSKKMNEFENILSEKNIEKSIESLYILKYIF